MPSIFIESKLFYYKKGQKDFPNSNPILAFIHGAGGDHTVWEKQIEFFSPLIPVVCPDLPGHGSSDSINIRAPVDLSLIHI